MAFGEQTSSLFANRVEEHEIFENTLLSLILLVFGHFGKIYAINIGASQQPKTLYALTTWLRHDSNERGHILNAIFVTQLLQRQGRITPGNGVC